MLKKYFFVIFLAGILMSPVFAQEKLPTITLFHGEECPHCVAERAFLSDLKKEYPGLEVVEYEVWHNDANQKIFKEKATELGIKQLAVPLTIIGDKYLLGFDKPENSGEKIKEMLGLKNGQQDKKLTYPLPILSVVLGFLDGFNPCSMWALITMITLILAIGDRKKLWIVGWTFIFVSGLSYFLFMTAWLNAFMFLGFVSAVRIIVGLIAIISGVAALNDFLAKKYNVCLIGNPEQQRKVTEKFGKILNANWWAIIAGVAGIAFSVNLVELMCSIGFPVIFTQALALHNAAVWQKYLYIILYVFFYMLLNIIVLLVAGFSAKFLVVNEKYIKYSHLIAGLMMLVLGLIFIFKPELLVFK